MGEHVIFVTFKVPAENAEKFLEAALDDATHSVKDEPGCKQFDVLRPEGDPTTFYFYEVYENRDAHAKHRTMPHYARFTEAVEKYKVERGNDRKEAVRQNG